MWFKYYVSNSNGNIKCPGTKKNIVAVHLSIKLFRASVANAAIGSLKSLQTLLIRIGTPCRCDLNQSVRNIQKFKLFNKTPFFKPFDKALPPFFEDVSVTETIVEC